MYARMSTFQARPGTLAELMSVLKGQPMRIPQQQEGFRGLLGLIDPVGDRLVAFTLWETEQQRTATGETTAYYQNFVSQISQFIQAPPQVENYEAQFLIELQEGATAARRTTATIQLGKMQAFKEMMRRSVTGAALQQAGIKGLLELLDPVGRNTMVVTFWDNEQALADSETSGYYQEQTMKMRDIIEGAPTREVFTVELQHLVLAHAR